MHRIILKPIILCVSTGDGLNAKSVLHWAVRDEEREWYKRNYLVGGLKPGCVLPHNPVMDPGTLKAHTDEKTKVKWVDAMKSAPVRNTVQNSVNGAAGFLLRVLCILVCARLVKTKMYCLYAIFGKKKRGPRKTRDTFTSSMSSFWMCFL